MARDAEKLIVPDFESYVSTRRDASGVRLLLDLIIYAGGLNLPHPIYEHPILRRLRHDAADIIAWAIVSPFPSQRALRPLTNAPARAARRTSRRTRATRTRATS